MDEFVRKNQSFAFETTFSGKEYAAKIRNWKAQNYEVLVYYLKLSSVELAIERVRLRVAHGGHNVSEHVIRRRYFRSWKNFQQLYRYIADSWAIFDTSGNYPVVIETSRDNQ